MKKSSSRKYWDRVYIQLPEGSNTATITVVPLKTIFINISAEPWENIDRIFYDVDDAEEFFNKMYC